jgi:hypothetical protein
MEGRFSQLSDHRGTTRLIHRFAEKESEEATDHLFKSVHFPVLPRQLPPLPERSQVMAWSMRFEPDRILFQVKAGNQNLAYFEAHIPFL